MSTFWNGIVQLQDALVSSRRLNLTALPGSINAISAVIYNSSGAILDTFPVSGTVSAAQSGVWNIGTVTSLTGITNALPSGTNLLGKVQITDGVDDVTVSSSIDSRKGIDIQHSSVASKVIIDFHSDDAAQRLTAGGTKIFSPDGTRNTYYDTQGYGLMLVDFLDNSPGASGGVLYIRWSRDGVNTGYNDPGDGTGLTNYVVAVDTTDGLVVTGRYIPIDKRYVNFVYVQGVSNQGSTYPQLCEILLTFVPVGFSTNVNVANIARVQGTGLPTDGPIIAGGVDNIAAPTQTLPGLMSPTGEFTVQGNRTIWTGTPIVSIGKLATSSTAATVAVAATSTQVFASQTARIGITVYNDSSQIIYLKKGTAASTTSFDWILQPYDTLSIPSGIGYSGVIHHIAAVATGNLRVSSW